MSGHRVERQEVGTPSEFAEIEAMSRAELIEFILATLESGELALDHKPESDRATSTFGTNGRSRNVRFESAMCRIADSGPRLKTVGSHFGSS